MTPMVSSDSSLRPRGCSPTRCTRLEAVEGEHALFDLADQAVLLVKRNVAAGVHDHLPEIGSHWGRTRRRARACHRPLHRDQQEGGKRERRARMAQRQPHGAHIGPSDAVRLSCGTGAALPSSAPSVGVKNSATASEADSVAISVIGRYS